MMNNMEVGVVIKHTDGGEREAYSLKKSKALEKNSNDMRSIFRLFTTPPNGKDLIVLRFLGSEGFLIAVIRLAKETNRGDDNSTAWIHIPDKLDFTGYDLVNLIDLVKIQMTAKSPEFDSIEKQIKNKDFKSRDVSHTMLSQIRSLNDANRYAYRLYGQGTDYQLHEILDPKLLAQKEYSDYSGVILLNNDDSISFKVEEKIAELKSPLRQTLILSAPNTTLGFQPYYKGKRFERPIEVYIDGTIELVWKQEGFKDVIKSHTVEPSDSDNSNWYHDVLPQETDKKYPIARNDFKVFDESGSPIQSFNLTIDEKPIRETAYFSESDLEKQVRVRIVASDYEPYEENLALKNIPRITLKRKDIVYPIELIDGTTGRLIIDGQNSLFHRRKSESPLKGYEIINGFLRYKSEITVPVPHSHERLRKWFKKWRIKVIALLITCIAIGGILVSTQSYKVRQRQQRTPPTFAYSDIGGGTTEEKTETLPLSITDYLEDEDTWNKDRLEKDSLTVGLFETLISLDVAKIKKISQEVSSDKLNKILSRLQKLQDEDQLDDMRKKTQHELQQMGNSINVNKYIELISQSLEQEEVAGQSSSQVTTEKPEDSKPATNKDKEQKPKDRGQK